MTSAVLLTPMGRGAVATLLVSGPQATTIVAACFRPASGKPLHMVPKGRIAFGRWGSPTGEEVVVGRRETDQWEIHCHGGEAAPQAIFDALVASGCQPVAWREWIAAEEPDPIVAASRLAMAEATTKRASLVLLDQYQGALREVVNQIAGDLAAGETARAITAVNALLRYADLGLHLTRPWKVVLAGRPNVGKSSLINALVGYQRAIVFDQPGTTRDVVTASTAIDGWPVELFDTAGLRAAHDTLEAAGIELARGQLDAADLVVLVCDASVDWTDEDEALLAETLATCNAQQTVRGRGTRNVPATLVVFNKADLPRSTAPRPAGLLTSAIRNAGIEELCQAIVAHLIPQVPLAGTAVPFTPEQVEGLRRIHAALDCGDLPAAKMCLHSTFVSAQA